MKNKNTTKLIIMVLILMAAVTLFGTMFLGNTELISEYNEEIMASANVKSKTSPFSTANAAIRYIGFFLLCFGAMYILPKWKKYKREKEQEYDEKVVKKAVSEIIPGAEFIRKDCIKPTTLFQYGIVPYFDTYQENGMIRYKRDGKEYSFSNIHLSYKRKDKDGNITYEPIYKGQVYTAHYKTGLAGTVRIFATKTIAVIEKETDTGYISKQKQETKIETENIQFNDNFDVYATDEQSAFFVLNPVVMEQLLEMKKNYEQVGVYINGDDMIVALKTNRILFPKRLYNSNQEELSLENSKQEAKKMLKMAKLLEDTINGSIKNNFTNMKKV